MYRRTTAIVVALSVLALASPLITGCTKPLADNSFNSGVDKYEQGDYQGAIADYNKAIEINLKDAITHTNRGNVKDDLEDYQGAIADYTKVIDMNPQFAPAYSIRGMSKYLLGDLKGACDDARKQQILAMNALLNG